MKPNEAHITSQKSPFDSSELLHAALSAPVASLAAITASSTSPTASEAASKMSEKSPSLALNSFAVMAGDERRKVKIAFGSGLVWLSGSEKNGGEKMV